MGRNVNVELDWRLNAMSLLNREIHVWRFDLDGSPALVLHECIDESERVRALRFAFAHDRNRFLRARYVMRKLLGQYLRVQPEKLHIETSRYGKPFLPDRHGLSFNLSHAGNCGMLAICTGFQIGVDIEEQRAPTDIRELVNSVFSKDEAHAVSTVADDELGIPFFTCWTRKEAYLKALGVGLTIDPRSVSVGVEPNLRRVPVIAGLDDSFVEVTTIIPEGRYLASIAAVGGFSTCRAFEFDDIGTTRPEDGTYVDRHLARYFEHKRLEHRASARVSPFFAPDSRCAPSVIIGGVVQ